MVVGWLSELTSIREDGLRLLVSIVAGYPLAFAYRTVIYKQPATVQHLFIAVAGVLLYLFNYGKSLLTVPVSIFLAYAITNHLRGTTHSVALAHICFLGHLLIGFWYAESDKYDITWTTPFCVMTLRHIGLVMDVYDGQKPKEKLKADQVETAIRDPPSLLETAAFSLFFSGTFVGPQFPLSRFRAFINGEFLDKDGEVPTSSIMACTQRFAAGVFFAVIHQWGTLWVPDAYFNSPEFFNAPFFWKIFWNVVWFRATMYRYVMAWLLTEGAAILSGLAYNGKDEDGQDRWDGVRDVHIILFETGSDFQSVIDSFNCGTNNFMKKHVFKRLRWLGNKYYSHLVTLLYLAIWHGYHLGYFLLFAFEFACIMAQDQVYYLIKRTPGAAEFFSNAFVVPLCKLFGRLTINMSMGFAFLTFGLVKKEIWIAPIKAMYFYGYIVMFIVWPLTNQVLLRVLPRKPKKDEKQANGKTE
ncbi:CBN-MBOA-6 protein [Aphelenchoides avenae]|nr:CBN-MBOA-6 protein [Aphelenchus avenae]